MDVQAIKQAVEVVGGQTALAKRLGVSQGLVWHWCAGKLRVRAEHCAAIEAATDSRVTRFELRPDVFGGVAVPDDAGATLVGSCAESTRGSRVAS